LLGKPVRSCSEKLAAVAHTRSKSCLTSSCDDAWHPWRWSLCRI